MKTKMQKKIKIKKVEEIKKMQEGGKKLADIKDKLSSLIKEGISAWEVEIMASRLIQKKGGEPSFKMVPGYAWTTCVNVNEGVVHGIPKDETIFAKGDIISVDVGMFFKGFHTDTSFSVGVSPSRQNSIFLESGKKALKLAIKQAKVGNRVYDISKTIEMSLETDGLTPIKALVGHGIGRDLHEEPSIPCFTQGSRGTSPLIPEGAVLAIEVMYTKGSSDVVLAEDGWTITTSDGKIAALFEETVAVTGNGPLILTAN